MQQGNGMLKLQSREEPGRKWKGFGAGCEAGGNASVE